MNPQPVSHPLSGPSVADHLPRVRIYAHRCPQATVLTISGDVDAANGQRIQEVATRFVSGPEALILDLSGVIFFGARGISVLIAIRDTRRTTDAPWAIIPNRIVSRVLQLTACAAELPSADSVQDALRLIDATGGGSR